MTLKWKTNADARAAHGTSSHDSVVPPKCSGVRQRLTTRRELRSPAPRPDGDRVNGCEMERGSRRLPKEPAAAIAGAPLQRADLYPAREPLRDLRGTFPVPPHGLPARVADRYGGGEGCA